MIEFIQQNWFEILSAVGFFISGASVIAKITKNETDNIWVARAQKVVDLLAMTTGKTNLK